MGFQTTAKICGIICEGENPGGESVDVKAEIDRRAYIKSVTMAASAAILGGTPLLGSVEEKKEEKNEEIEDVSPVEDLMREHGALYRILLIYEEALRRMKAKKEMNPALLKQSAKIIHDFIEGYHEKLEEESIFPRLKKENRLSDTVDTLLLQHRVGRMLTEKIMNLSTEAHFGKASDRANLTSELTSFIRMYRPHAAREGMIVFPQFKKLISPKEYDALGDQFEGREHELFGKEGFEGVVAEIEKIEGALGIYDLTKFTPRSF